LSLPELLSPLEVAVWDFALHEGLKRTQKNNRTGLTSESNLRFFQTHHRPEYSRILLLKQGPLTRTHHWCDKQDKTGFQKQPRKGTTMHFATYKDEDTKRGREKYIIVSRFEIRVGTYALPFLDFLEDFVEEVVAAIVGEACSCFFGPLTREASLGINAPSFIKSCRSEERHKEPMRLHPNIFIELSAENACLLFLTSALMGL
jgi:hypothetical protein